MNAMQKTKHVGIYIRPRKNGGQTYYVRMKIGGKPYKKAAGSRLADAQRHRARILLARDDEKFGIVRVWRTIFHELAQGYLDYYRTKAKRRNWPRVESIIRQLDRFFGNQDISKINIWTIEHYARIRIEAGRDPATVNLELDYLRTMLNKAAEWGKLERPPKIKPLPVQGRPRSRELNDHEICHILENVSPDHRDAVIIALDTGMRLGEIFRIIPGDLRGNVLHISDTKSLKPRDIPLTPRALEILRRRFNHSIRMFKDISEQQLGRRFRLERQIMLDLVDRWRFHDLRHTFATRLLNAGVDPYTLMEILGHSKLEMVTRYLHTSMDRKRAAIAGLDRPILLVTKKRPRRRK
jgi:integrase